MPSAAISRALAAIRAFRFNYSSEVDLQLGLMEAFRIDGLAPRREQKINGGRIDILIGRLGIEVKCAGTPSEVRRQLRRYSMGGDVDALILVTNRVRHRMLETQLPAPSGIAGDIPLYVEVLNSL